MKNASPCFHNSLFTIVIVLLGLTVVSCSKDDDEVTPNPDMNALYAQSIKDAMVDNGSEADRKSVV